jgi:hypothetical protein
VLVQVSLIGLSACALERMESSRRACAPPPPAIAVNNMERAQIRAQRAASGVQVGMALRDSSVTIVGLCIPHPALLSPSLMNSDRSKQSRVPFGGSLVNAGGAWYNYILFPPPASANLKLNWHSKTLAYLSFPRAEAASICSLRANPPFRVITCGALVLVAWSTTLGYRASRIEGLDVRVVDKTTDSPLGFYYMGARQGPRGAVIQFGFEPPSNKLVLVEMRGVSTLRQDGVASTEHAPNPPMRAVLQLDS